MACTVRKLAASGKTMIFIYEAGPCGFGIHRWLRAQGHECWVVSPSLTPKKPGERIKTDRRDAIKLARLARAGELVAIYVPEAADEALRDLVRAREDAVAMQRQARHRLVPSQDSSGGKTRLGQITKRGDTYLRGLLTQGARSALQVALTKAPLQRTRLQASIVQLHARVGYHKTLVAIATKHARMIWAVLTKGEDYDPDAWRRWSRPAAATSSVTP